MSCISRLLLTDSKISLIKIRNNHIFLVGQWNKKVIYDLYFPMHMLFDLLFLLLLWSLFRCRFNHLIWIETGLYETNSCSRFSDSILLDWTCLDFSFFFSSHVKVLLLESFSALFFLLFICMECREHSEEMRTLTLSGQRTKFLKLLLLLLYFFSFFCFWTLFLLQCKHQPWNLLKCWPVYFKSSAPLNSL